MKLIFATANRHKLQEAQEILGPGFELSTPADAGLTEDIPETGNSLKDNSLQKAKYIHDRLGADCFADDSGLEVDALDGAPGVHTARYAGPGRDSDANMDKLLHELAMKGPGVSRKARFHTWVTLIMGGEVHCFEGVMEGWIAFEKAGCGGFGYDPVFIPDACPDRTVAELPEEFKNSISHRGNALRALAGYLASLD